MALEQRNIAVIGLGYVGLPLALALASKYKNTVGFDISKAKIAALSEGIDPTDEGLDAAIKSTTLKVTCAEEDLKGSDFFIIGVPTPIDTDKRPDLSPLNLACSIVGKALTKGGIVVFESTVYPGLTEEYCGPLLEKASGLVRGRDFFLGYSPERINPGDKQHTLQKITKVVSAENPEALAAVTEVYGSIIEAGLFPAASIRVAEAAKVIENTQRDLNIALMNELAIIFDRMGISTRDVLDAANTKWNFLNFVPGLVGGHCIDVDPYYLTAKAEQLGYHPQVILSGRRINDDMGKFIAQRLVKLMVNASFQIKDARVGILGVTFKENVTDIRNSRVPDIIRELKEFGITTLIHDPHADPHHIREEYGFELAGLEEFSELDGLVYAVPHEEYKRLEPKEVFSRLRKGGVFVDIKSTYHKTKRPSGFTYWSL